MIPYLFISGFLGAGKTTLLNNLLRRYRDLKIGVIVNDFGELAVDNMLIEKESVTGTVKELRAGQIFCSCLSGSFINTVLAFKDTPVDVLFIECSGLAKPSTLSDIVQVIDKRAPGGFSCLGMISVIDATRHAILEQSLLVITEQIESSDILLLSKCEQVLADDYEQLRNSLADRYPDKHIFRLQSTSIEPDIIELLKNKTNAFIHVDKQKHMGWGDSGRPESFILQPPSKTSHEVQETLNQFQSRWYRIKGTIETTDKGFLYFDGTEDQLHIHKSNTTSDNGLVIITHDRQLEQEVRAAFNCPVKKESAAPQNTFQLSF